MAELNFRSQQPEVQFLAPTILRFVSVFDDSVAAVVVVVVVVVVAVVVAAVVVVVEKLAC